MDLDEPGQGPKKLAQYECNFVQTIKDPNVKSPAKRVRSRVGHGLWRTTSFLSGKSLTLASTNLVGKNFGVEAKRPNAHSPKPRVRSQIKQCQGPTTQSQDRSKFAGTPKSLALSSQIPTRNFPSEQNSSRTEMDLELQNPIQVS